MRPSACALLPASWPDPCEKGDFDPALADFDQVMIMRPNDAECYLNRGSVWRERV